MSNPVLLSSVIQQTISLPAGCRFVKVSGSKHVYYRKENGQDRWYVVERKGGSYLVSKWSGGCNC